MKNLNSFYPAQVSVPQEKPEMQKKVSDDPFAAAIEEQNMSNQPKGGLNSLPGMPSMGGP